MSMLSLHIESNCADGHFTKSPILCEYRASINYSGNNLHEGRSLILLFRTPERPYFQLLATLIPHNWRGD